MCNKIALCGGELRLAGRRQGGFVISAKSRTAYERDRDRERLPARAFEEAH